MGITIHYKGSLKSRDQIDKLRIELIDISKTMGWQHTLVEPDETEYDTHPPIYGIIIDMKNDCELLAFIFDEDGNIRSSIALSHFDYSDKYQLIASVKTQFSSPEEHIIIIKLLRYIKKVYIKNLKVTDEGEFWDSSDKKRLEYLFDFLNKKIQAVGDIFEANKDSIKSNLNSKALAKKLENLIKKHLDSNVKVKQIRAPKRRKN